MGNREKTIQLHQQVQHQGATTTLATRLSLTTPMKQRTTLSPRLADLSPMATMGEVGTGCSNIAEEDGPPGKLHQTNLVAYTAQGCCPQHCKIRGRRPKIKLLRHAQTPSADRLHHHPGPPSWHITGHDRATTPHDLAAHSPSCKDKLPIDHVKSNFLPSDACTKPTTLLD
jgi:hypothetical protein